VRPEVIVGDIQIHEGGLNFSSLWHRGGKLKILKYAVALRFITSEVILKAQQVSKHGLITFPFF
jgi:hypothetical protein